jgi:hypothetical protein
MISRKTGLCWKVGLGLKSYSIKVSFEALH